MIEETKMVTLQQRNYFKPGDEVEFFGPEIENFHSCSGKLYGMKNGNEIRCSTSSTTNC